MNVETNPGSTETAATTTTATTTTDATTTTAAAATNSEATDASQAGSEKGAENTGTSERKNADGTVMTPEQLVADDARLAAEAAYNAPAPDAYEFKVPEGFTLDEDRSKTATEFFKKLGLSQPKAQEAIDLFCKVEGENGTLLMGMVEAKRQQDVADWGEDAKKVLGADYEPVMVDARKAVTAINDPQLTADFDAMGWGNRLSLIKAFAFFGKLVADSPMRGINNETVKATERTAEERLFQPLKGQIV